MGGFLYRRLKGKQPKLVVPQSLIQDVIAENHDPIFVAHPGSKRTFELISLRYWWSKMRKNIQEYVRRCDKCPNRRGKHEFRDLLGEVEEPSEPLQVTSMDIKGPYCITPRKTPILLTFMDVVYSCFDVMQRACLP
jgi:hypothetical protein